MASWNQCNAQATADSSDTNAPENSLSSALTPAASHDPAEDDGAQQSQKQNTHSTLPTVLVSGDDILDERCIKEIESVIPKKRQNTLKWFGWGYTDSEFFVKDYKIHFRGPRYPLENGLLPLFTDWVHDIFNCTFHNSLPHPAEPTEFPKATINEKFVQLLQASGISHSFEGIDRLYRCHGQTMHDMYNLLNNNFKRIPDVVTWPKCHNDVVQLVEMANRHNVVIVPYGGGTSVSDAVTCPQKETRMICVLDTSQMNRMLWFNKTNLTVCFESGIVGQDLERTMHEMGMTVGHEPDSYEFSTLGGWVATRASGMKKNLYGNIEDLVVQLKMVTPTGVLERKTSAPRVSCGPDFNHIILGSEGTLGVITEVVLKVRPLPKVKSYNCLIFPNFESGVEFMREVAGRRCQPSSVRLMDNAQFVMGQTLKPPKTFKDTVADYIKHKYLTVVKGISMDQICAATLLFEGEAGDVSRQESLIISIAKKHNGFAGGAKNGEKGYILTYVIAYIRDLGLAHNIVAESFETSVPWDRCVIVCTNVKKRVELECHARSINFFCISSRVTQTYDAGACIYFYLGFNYKGFSNPLELFEEIEAAAREEVLFCGGSISHHHGIGKIRTRWYKSTISDAGAELYKATKLQLDPKNIFATANLLTPADYSAMAAKAEAAVEASDATTANRIISKL